MNCIEFKSIVSNLELGWTNSSAFEDQFKKLLSYKNYALKCQKKLQKEGYDVIDIYNQAQEFQNCIFKQVTFTEEREEAIILAALEYVESNRPIICSKMNKDFFFLNSYLPEEEKKSLLRYKYDVYCDLVSFYLSYRDQIDLYEVFIKFLDFNEYLLNSYPSDAANYYSVPYIVTYLKFLLKKKEVEKANFIIKSFTIIPRGKGDTLALEKVKQKLMELPKISDKKD